MTTILRQIAFQTYILKRQKAVLISVSPVPLRPGSHAVGHLQLAVSWNHCWGKRPQVALLPVLGMAPGHSVARPVPQGHRGLLAVGPEFAVEVPVLGAGPSPCLEEGGVKQIRGCRAGGGEGLHSGHEGPLGGGQRLGLDGEDGGTTL